MAIGLTRRVFANGSGDRGFFTRSSHPKDIGLMRRVFANGSGDRGNNL